MSSITELKNIIENKIELKILFEKEFQFKKKGKGYICHLLRDKNKIVTKDELKVWLELHNNRQLPKTYNLSKYGIIVNNNFINKESIKIFRSASARPFFLQKKIERGDGGEL